MSILELVELIKRIEEVFGVSMRDDLSYDDIKEFLSPIDID